jgi:hypothetical protein
MTWRPDYISDSKYYLSFYPNPVREYEGGLDFGKKNLLVMINSYKNHNTCVSSLHLENQDTLAQRSS